MGSRRVNLVARAVQCHSPSFVDRVELPVRVLPARIFQLQENIRHGWQPPLPDRLPRSLVCVRAANRLRTAIHLGHLLGLVMAIWYRCLRIWVVAVQAQAHTLKLLNEGDPRLRPCFTPTFDGSKAAHELKRCASAPLANLASSLRQRSGIPPSLSCFPAQRNVSRAGRQTSWQPMGSIGALMTMEYGPDSTATSRMCSGRLAKNCVRRDSPPNPRLQRPICISAPARIEMPLSASLCHSARRSTHPTPNKAPVCRAMAFYSNRPGGQGEADLWMSRRVLV